MKRSFQALFILPALLLISACSLKFDYSNNLKAILTELVNTAEKPSSLKVARTVYFIEKNDSTFYLRFSLEDYYGVTQFHSMIALFELGKQQYSYFHTGLGYSIEEKNLIQSEVEYVFNIIPEDETGTYQGYRNIDSQTLYQITLDSIQAYYKE